MSFGYSVGDILTTLKLADDLKKRFAQAPKEFKAISDEVKQVWSVLHDIDDIPIDGLNEQQRQQVQTILQGCQEVLDELKAKLDKSHILAYTTPDWKTRARQAWKRITWDQTDIDRFRDRITSAISLFNLLMGRINQNLSIEIRNETQALTRELEDTSREKVLSWISPINGSKRQSEILSSRQPGTGTWFIEKKAFQKWVDDEKQLLYCPGIPGAGKTVLCSIAVDHLEQRFASNDKVGISYFFFDFRKQWKLTEILAGLLRQLVQGQTHIPPSTRSLERGPVDSISLDQVQSELFFLTSDFFKTFIILDALDECPATGGVRRQLLEFLFSLHHKANVNILATSRPDEEIVKSFANTGNILEIQANDQDIRTYTHQRTAYFPAFVLKKSNLRAHIRDEIAKASKGMFLLAKLYVNLVQDEINEKRIRQVVERLQNGTGAYDDAYDETMKRIERQGQYAQELAKTIFGWVLFSTRPLTLLEIQHALAVEIGAPEFDETNKTDIEQLISTCIGLVTIDGQTDSLKFVHYTTQEYFERKWNYWFPDIHRVIANACLTYVSFDAFDEGPCRTEEQLNDRLDNYPFYKYAAQAWGHHCRKNFGEQSMTMSLLENEAKVHASSQIIFGFSRGAQTTKRKIEGSVDEYVPLIIKESLKGAHLAAFFGLLSPIVAMLSSQTINVDIKDYMQRTPLSWAAAYGHEALVSMLLQEGADPDSTNGFGLTPLFYAAVSGNMTTMKSLIDAGANVNALDLNGRTPLFHAAHGDPSHMGPLASEGDCGAAAKLLLGHGVCAVQVDALGQTPLFAAAENGRDSVVKLLIERDAHLYYALASGSVAFDPLVYAAMNGHATTAKLLVESGTHSMSEQAPSYLTLANLLRAGSEGRDDDFKNLLQDEGADLNARDMYHRLPLHWAAMKGDDTLVRCLLGNGADVNARDEFGRTPLYYALCGNRQSTTLLLLEHPGIDHQCTDVFGDNPLAHSYKRRHRGNQWKLHNHLKIKNGQYDGLLRDTGVLQMQQAPLRVSCDACLCSGDRYFSCENCTFISQRIGAGVSGARFCDSCISSHKPCPLCGRSLVKLQG